MTHAEFNKLPVLRVSHLSLDTVHFKAYKIEAPKGNIVLHICVRKLKNGEFGKAKRTYIFRGKEYKTIDELLKDYNGTE